MPSRFLWRMKQRFISLPIPRTALLIATGLAAIFLVPMSSVSAESYRNTLSFIDSVDPYQKEGLVEIYGGELRLPKDGPVGIKSAQFQILDSHALLVWSQGRFPADGATHLELRFERPVSARLPFRVGIALRNGEVHTFYPKDQFTFPDPSSVGPYLRNIPDELIAGLEKQGEPTSLEKIGEGLYRAPLVDLRLDSADPGTGIDYFFIEWVGAQGQTVSIRNLGLVTLLDEPGPDTIDVKGRVIGNAEPGTPVRMLSEAGETRSSALAADMEFTFADVPADSRVSIWFREAETDFFVTHGRWIEAATAQGRLVIDTRPRIPLSQEVTNPEKPKPPPRDLSRPNSSLFPRKSKYFGLRVPHSRQLYTGIPGKVTEFHNIAFANNYGYFDRDRFFDNPDGCFRAVVMGPSTITNIMHRTTEKFNVLLEAELGVRLQKCAEIIAAGQGGAPPSNHYQRMETYVRAFKPDVVLIEVEVGTLTFLHPILQQKILGVDPEHPRWGAVYYDEGGRLQFRPRDVRYRRHLTPRDMSPLKSDVLPNQALLIPYDRMPPEGRETFAIFRDFLDKLKRENPDIRFILFSFHAQIRAAQDPSTGRQPHALENGETTELGFEIFAENVRRFCEENNFECIVPPLPSGIGDEDRYLTWRYDNHLSYRGQQWLSHMLTDALAP